MKPSLILFVLFTFSTLSSFSQINERQPGYILDTNGDTLRGFIKVRNDIVNTQACLFSPELDGEYKEYTPADISEYRFDIGKYYVAQKFELNEKEVEMFVEFLVDGIVDLYYFRTEEKERYLIEKEGVPKTVIEGEIIVEVDYDKHDEYKDQARYNDITKNFESDALSKGQLAYLFREDPLIKENLETLSFNQRSMIKLTKSYHNKVCDGSDCIVFNKSTNLSSRSFGIFVGATLGNINFREENGTYISLTDVEISRKPKPTIGINYNTTMPYIHSKICTDLYLGFSEHYFKYLYNGANKEGITEFSYKQIRLTAQVGYYLVKTDKISINPSLGVSGIILFNGVNNITYSYANIGYKEISNFEVIPEENKFLISFNAGLHSTYKLNKYLELKPAIIYEFINNMDNVESVNSISHVFYFKIGLNKTLKQKEK